MTDAPDQPTETPPPPAGFDPLGDVLLCVAFFTRLKVQTTRTLPLSRLGHAIWAFPLVGLFIGFSAGMVGFALTILLADAIGTLVPAVAATLLALMWTGALHEDGLADTADGFGGGMTRTRKLEIMRDSRIGTYGVIALIVALTLRIAGLQLVYAPMVTIDHYASLLSGALFPLMLASVGPVIAAATVSRAAVGVIMASLPPARIDGLAGSAGRAPAWAAALAVVLAVAPLFIILAPDVVVIGVIAAGTASFAVFTQARHHVGGQTGDVLGAVQVVSEVAFLLVAGTLMARSL